MTKIPSKFGEQQLVMVNYACGFDQSETGKYLNELLIYTCSLQYRSNVSYHLSSRFSRDSSRFLRGESRFSREGSRFSRESLKRSVWNILLIRSRYQSDGTHRRDDKKDSSLQLLASLKIISIYLVLFGRIG